MTDNKQNEQNFSIVNIYTKDISFESPNSPQVFSTEWKPIVDFDLQMSSNKLEDNLYEVILNLTVTTKVKVGTEKDKVEEKTAFLTEVQQAGIFSIAGFSENEIEQILAITTQEILFPYARETISSLVSKGGFPAMLLPPVNFNALYLEHKQKQKETAANEA